MRIGEILVREGKLKPEKLDKALRVQARMGDRLGTTLLEMGSVDENTLLGALGRQRSTKTASASELASAPESVVRLIPAKLAKRYGIVPYRLKGRTLFVASRDAGDLLKEDEIGFLTSCMVRTCIALEVRVAEALERHYRLGASTRHQALAQLLSTRRQGSPARERRAAPKEPPRPATPLAVAPPAVAPPAVAPPAVAPPAEPPTHPSLRRLRAGAKKAEPPKPAPPPQPLFIELDEEDAALLGKSGDPGPAWPPPDQPVLLEPAPLPWVARERAEGASGTAASGSATAPRVATAPGTDSAPSGAELAFSVEPPSFAPPDVEVEAAGPDKPAADAESTSLAESLDEWLRSASAELKHAEIRDDIADVLLNFSEPFFRRRVLLIARKDRIVGWRGEGEGLEEEKIRAIEIPSGEPSVFVGLTGPESFWLGTLPTLDANRALIEGLGGEPPLGCVVLPVTLRSRVVCYLYGDNLGAGVAGAPLAEIRRLAAKAGLAFEVYILKNKMRML